MQIHQSPWHRLPLPLHHCSLHQQVRLSSLLLRCRRSRIQLRRWPRAHRLRAQRSRHQSRQRMPRSFIHRHWQFQFSVRRRIQISTRSAQRLLHPASWLHLLPHQYQRVPRRCPPRCIRRSRSRLRIWRKSKRQHKCSLSRSPAQRRRFGRVASCLQRLSRRIPHRRN